MRQTEACTCTTVPVLFRLLTARARVDEMRTVHDIDTRYRLSSCPSEARAQAQNPGFRRPTTGQHQRAAYGVSCAALRVRDAHVLLSAG